MQFAIIDADALRVWRQIHPVLRDVVDTRRSSFSVHVKNAPVVEHPAARVTCMVFEHECPWTIQFPCFSLIQHLELWQDRMLTDPLLVLMPALKTLILPKNKFVSDKGIAPLHHLTVLDLQHNRRITDAGLKGKKHLICFRNDWSNKITDDAFWTCTHMKQLHLGYNNHPKLRLAFLHRLTELRSFVSLSKKTIPLTALPKLQMLEVFIMPKNIQLNRMFISKFRYLQRFENMRVCIGSNNNKCVTQSLDDAAPR